MLKKIALIAALFPFTAAANGTNVVINLGGQFGGFPSHQTAGLAGNWNWTAKCPLITTYGTATFEMTSDSTYSGTAKDTLGQSIKLSGGQINGQSFSHQARTGLLSAVERGTLSPDGQTYHASNSFGCQISATRS